VETATAEEALARVADALAQARQAVTEALS
jgi:hypothetical protein